jgi:tRNA/rRNA methyltransferase
MATTARTRSMTQLVYTPSSAAATAVTLANDISTGIIFGPESSGLTNDDVAIAHGILNIPSFKHFSSLNLAQAVNIVGYEAWSRRLELTAASPPPEWLHPRDGERKAIRSEVDNFLERFENALDDRAFQQLENRRKHQHRLVKNIFYRTKMTKAEVDSLHGVLTALLRPPGGDKKGDGV